MNHMQHSRDQFTIGTPNFPLGTLSTALDAESTIMALSNFELNLGGTMEMGTFVAATAAISFGFFGLLAYEKIEKLEQKLIQQGILQGEQK